MAKTSVQPEGPCRSRLIVFDLDGTLVRSTVDFVKLKLETIRLLNDLGFQTKNLSEKMKTYEIMEWVRKKAECRGLDYQQITSKIAEVWNSIELKEVDKTEAMPGANAVLSELRNRGFLIGVVTRGCHIYAVRALEAAGLLRYVNIVLGRDDTCNPKPDPEPLLCAMSMFNAKPSEVVMVGDSM
ncbi:MAG: HAD family hydrolase, partial [Candidatus Bathyarchaeia archaeon]